MFIVSAVTFSIFFLVPRLAGASSEDLASRYVGRDRRTADRSHATAERLGFTDPLPVQYGRFVKGLFVGANHNLGPTTEHCPAPCFGYSFVNQAPVWPDLLDRLPVTLSLAAGAAVLWLLGGVSIGIISALRRGTVFDRASMGVALAGVSLPIFFTGLLLLTIFSYKLGLTAPGGSYTPFQVEPRSLGVRPDPALGRAGLPVRRRVCPADPSGHAGDDERGLHPHRPGQGPARAHGGAQARPARRRSPRS